MAASRPATSLTVIQQDKHPISIKDISHNALKVLRRLDKAGYEAYLVGGGVRDLLLGKMPKDFDITTNATPEQTRALFGNSRLIGRRFRLVHVIFGREVIEVATFRGDHSPESEAENRSRSHNGMILRDNTFGTIADDARRRDLTINSLYYCPADLTLRDYVGGLRDLDAGIVRIIGDAETRYREDPVRMLRVVRFAAKLDMRIAAETANPITSLADLLSHIPPARLFEESLKLLQTGCGAKVYPLLRKYRLFQPLFPLIQRHFTPSGDSPLEKIIIRVLENTDQRLANGQRINPAFLFATLFWYPMVEQAQRISQEGGLHYHEAFALAISETLDEACKVLALPRRITTVMRDIWFLQLRLPRRQGGRALKALEHPKFRATYDLLLLRAEAEESPDLHALAEWWEAFQYAQPAKQQKMLSLLTNSSRRRARQPRTQTDRITKDIAPRHD